ncbi:MAG: DUF5050 domain-containing protein [Ruminococcus sp.]
MDNIDSMGFMAIQDDYMFFYQKSPNQGLYRSKIDSSDKTKLASGFIHDINVIGNKIYYVKEEFVSKTTSDLKDLYSFCLYSIDIDGNNENKLIEDCNKVYVTPQYIYYLFEIDRIAYKYNEMSVPYNQNYLYRYSIENKTSELIVSDHVNTYRVHNDDILFTDYNQDIIYSVSSKDSDYEKSVVFDSKSSSENGICFFTIDSNGSIIVCDGKILFSLDSVTSDKKVIYEPTSEISFDNFILSDDFIYTIENEKTVLKINLNNDTNEQLFEINRLDDTPPYLYLFNNECYYFDGINLPILV